MKSAAFNLAFKVHRNEMPFAEGLLKSVEADAQHDFIEALNSLAGEMRYDVEKIDSMIEESRQSLEPKKKPKYDIKALKEELNQIKKKRNEILETIQSVEGRINILKPNIIVGINAFFIALIGFVLALIFFLVGLAVFALIILAGILIGCLLSVMHDLNVLKKQQADIAQKKLRYMNQITDLNKELEKVDETLHEKEEFIKSVQGDRPAENSETPADMGV